MQYKIVILQVLGQLCIMAELEQTVIEAMHFAFSERRELLESDLILAANQLIPLSKTTKSPSEI